jgi:PPP family 3-phenylpropionic acid transporter
VSAADPNNDVNHRALRGLAVAYVVTFASGGIQLPLLALAMEKQGYAPEVVGGMWAVRALLGALVPVFWGLLADRVGSGRPLVIGSLAIGAGLLLWLSTSPAPWVCLLIFGLYGLFTNPAGSLMDGMTLTALGPRKEQFGRWRAFGTVGFGASTLIVTFLLEHQVLQPLPSSLLPLCALFTGGGGLCVFFFVPRIPRPQLSDPRVFLTAFRVPLLLGLIFIGTLLWASHAAYASFLAPLTERVGLGPSVIGWVIAAAVVVEAVAMTASPTLLRWLGARAIVVGAAVLATLRWLLAAQVTTAAGFVAVHAVHGLTFGLFFIVITGLVAERAPPELRQASQGLLSSLSFGFGGFIGGLVCGQALAMAAAAAPVWLAMAALAASSVVASALITRKLDVRR